MGNAFIVPIDVHINGYKNENTLTNSMLAQKNRKQVVKFNNYMSSIINVTSGVPQETH